MFILFQTRSGKVMGPQSGSTIEEVLRRFTEVEDPVAELSLWEERNDDRSIGRAEPTVRRSRRRHNDAERSDDGDDRDEKPTAILLISYC